jgi:nucleoid DNA-binding protein
MPKSKKKKVTQEELIDTMAKECDMSKSSVKEFFEKYANFVKRTLKDGASSTLPGLFIFTPKKVAAKAAKSGVKNNLTGKVSRIAAKPEKMKVQVKPVSALKTMLDNNKLPKH